MTTKQGMAAQFTEITLDEMEKFLKRGWRALRPKKGAERREVYYDLTVSDQIIIRVWTSIGVGREVGADVGSDAIRVQYMSKRTGRPLVKGKAPIVKRTQGWKGNLQKRIEDYLELYEERESELSSKPEVQEPEAQEPEPTLEPTSEPEPEPGREPKTWRATFMRWPAAPDEWALKVEGTEVQPGDTAIAETKGGRRTTFTVGRIYKVMHDRFSGGMVSIVEKIQDRYRNASECCGGTGVRPDGQPCQCGGACKAASEEYESVFAAEEYESVFAPEEYESVFASESDPSV